jgi:hypothetical protein
MTLHPIPLNFLIYEDVLFYFLSVYRVHTTEELEDQDESRRCLNCTKEPLAGEEYFSFFLCLGFWLLFFLCFLTGNALRQAVNAMGTENMPPYLTPQG